MVSPDDSLTSLLAALQDGREKPVPVRAWTKMASQYLMPGETVLLALEGFGFTWWDPLLLVTNRRVVCLRRGTISPWRKIREVPVTDVLEAEFRKLPLWWGTVVLRTRGGKELRVPADKNEAAQRFADGVNRLTSSGMR